MKQTLLLLLLSPLILGCSPNTSSYANHGRQYDDPARAHDPSIPDNYYDDGNQLREEQGVPPPPRVSFPPPPYKDSWKTPPKNTWKVPSKPFLPSSPVLPPALSVYTSSRYGYSLYYPTGWRVMGRRTLVSLYGGRNTRWAPQMHIITLNYPKRIGTIRARGELLKYLRTLSTTLQIKSQFPLRGSSKARALTFSLRHEGRQIEGFAIVFTLGKIAVYSLILGPMGAFRFNAPLTLGYILQSINSKGAPKKPTIPLNSLIWFGPPTGKDTHMGVNDFRATVRSSLVF